ncbi:MAG TPA: class I tRNA ligase family protein, partial [Thermoplasmata archaeon]|nr:class I tRNA ligase family protein [Thermoplasmata archaeon]
FPVFLSTHALLLAPRWQPRSVIAHGWLTGPGGGKISKKEVTSKGGAIPPVRDALDRWGADALRLYLLQSASASQDFEWDPARVEAVQGRLEEVERLVRNALEAGSGGPPELDRWLESRVHEILTRFEEAFSRADLRGVAEAVYAELPSVVRRYLVRGGSSGAALQKAAVAWIRLMSPITPPLAEELFQGRGDRLVAAGPLPDPTEFARAPGAVVAEALVDRVEDDLRSVLRPAQARGNAPDEVIFYIAAPWKTTVERWLRKPSMTPGQVPSLRSIMERAASVPELSAYRDRIPKYVQRIAPGLLSEPPMPEETVDELGLLRSLEGYLVRRFGFRSVAVFEEDSAADHDPAGRRERARPGRPAFYLYGGATHSAGPGGSSPSAGGGRSRAEPPSPPSASGGSARPPGGEKR